MELASIVLGAVGKKVVEAAWDGGRNLLARVFSNSPKTLAIAEERGADFMNRLAVKVERLEEQQGYDHTVIENAMIDPAFASMFHRALIHSAETARETNHSVLANLVAERLVAGEDTTKASALILAAEEASRLSTGQFTALAVYAIQRFGAPRFDQPIADEAEYVSVCRKRLEELILPFKDVEISASDMRYLIGTSCGVHNSFHMGDQFVPAWKFSEWKLKTKVFKELLPIVDLEKRWSHRLWFFEPTVVGDLIGLAVMEATGASDLNLGTWQ